MNAAAAIYIRCGHGVSTILPVVRRLLRSSILVDLGMPPGNRLEALKGSARGPSQHTDRQQCRIVFRWTDDGADEIMIEDHH